MKMNKLLVLVPQLLLVVAVVASHIGVASANDTLTTTTESPCSIPLDLAVLPFEDLDIGASYFKPSYINTCLSSLAVNATLLKSHITSLQSTFAEYFVFYELAKDVAASNPLNYQAELGYTLFEGAAEGQVDLEAELLGLVDHITATSKDDIMPLTTFWNISTIFAKLYDPHVVLPPLTGVAGQLIGVYGLSCFPARNLVNATRMYVLKMAPSYNAQGELELAIHFQNPNDGSVTQEQVATIMGRTPYEFYMDMIGKPELAFNYPYQSVGARMNGAFANFLPRNGPTSLEAFRIGSRSNPTDILPDTFDVVYTSGEMETYYTGLSYKLWNTSMVYDHANSMAGEIMDSPGSAFTNFAIAVSEIMDTVNTTLPTNVAAPSRQMVPPPPIVPPVLDDDEEEETTTTATTSPTTTTTPPMEEEESGPYDWDYIINLPSMDSYDGRTEVGAYKIDAAANFAVLKIQTFQIGYDDNGQEAMLIIWKNFTTAAQEAGVTKAMIDISGNGGGRIQAGNFLATLMYPSIPFDVFQQEYDITYNDLMQVFYATVNPVLQDIKAIIEPLTDDELQQYLNDVPEPETIFELLSSQVETLFFFCCDGGGEVCSDPRCQQLGDLGNSIIRLGIQKDGAQLGVVLEELIASFLVYNPFNVLGTLEGGEIDPAEMYPYNRGGEVVQLTNKFGVFLESMYNASRDQSTESNNFTFEEYMILSDGKAGSTACIFSSMMMQVWKNENDKISLVPLTTVTYGGTKNPADTTVAGAPASVQNTKISIPIITSGLLYMLETLLPPDLARNVTTVNQIYQEYLPLPSYFSDGFSSMPVYNYYSSYMGATDAIPLQYVQMAADQHIQQVFNGNTLKDSTDLRSLYQQAAALGVIGDPPPASVDKVEPSGIEASSTTTSTERRDPLSWNIWG